MAFTVIALVDTRGIKTNNLHGPTIVLDSHNTKQKIEMSYPN